jgi:hypothetical protein
VDGGEIQERRKKVVAHHVEVLERRKSGGSPGEEGNGFVSGRSNLWSLQSLLHRSPPPLFHRRSRPWLDTATTEWIRLGVGIQERHDKLMEKE